MGISVADLGAQLDWERRARGGAASPVAGRRRSWHRRRTRPPGDWIESASVRGDKRDGESGEQVGKNQSCLLYHGGWLAPDLAANILAADFRAAVSPASWRKRYAGAPKSTMASQKRQRTKREPDIMGMTNILVRLALVGNKTDLYSRNKKKVWSGLPSPEEVADAETVDVASYCSRRRATTVVRCYKLQGKINHIKIKRWH